MRLSQMLWVTLREDPAEAELTSHKLHQARRFRLVCLPAAYVASFAEDFGDRARRDE
jgi:hypothetical protein